MNKYRKAIVAVLGGAVTLLAPVIPGIEEYASAELIQALSVIITTAGVYQVPNEAAS